MPPGVRFLPDPGNASEPNYDVDAPVDFWLSVVTERERSQAARLERRQSPSAGSERGAGQRGCGGDFRAADEHRSGPPGADRQSAAAHGRPQRRGTSVAAAAVRIRGARLSDRVCQRVGPPAGERPATAAGIRRALGARRPMGAIVPPGADRECDAGADRWRARWGARGSARGAVQGDWRSCRSPGRCGEGGMASLCRGPDRGITRRGDCRCCCRLCVPRCQIDFAPSTPGVLTTGRGERRLLGAVAVMQIVLTVALLAGAVLMIRTAQNLAKVRPGYDTDNTLVMTVTSVQSDTWKDFHTRALERVAALPGVTHAAFVWGLPLTGNKWNADMEIVGQAGSTRLAEQLNLPLRAVTPDYFEAMNIQIVDGRGFRPSDDADAPRVALINADLRAAPFRRRYSSRPKGPVSRPEPQADRNRRRRLRHANGRTQRDSRARDLFPSLAAARILQASDPPYPVRPPGVGRAGPARAARGRSHRRGRAREDDGGCAAGVGGVTALCHASADRLCGDGDRAGAGRVVRGAIAVGRRPHQGDRGAQSDRGPLAGNRSVSCCAKGIA